MGWAKQQDDPNDPSQQSQRVVSFSETPLEHIYSLVADILGRQINLKPHGLAEPRDLEASEKSLYARGLAPGGTVTFDAACRIIRLRRLWSGSLHHRMSKT